MTETFKESIATLEAKMEIINGTIGHLSDGIVHRENLNADDRKKLNEQIALYEETENAVKLLKGAFDKNE